MPSSPNSPYNPPVASTAAGGASTASARHQRYLVGGTVGGMSDSERWACHSMIPNEHVAVREYRDICSLCASVFYVVDGQRVTNCRCPCASGLSQSSISPGSHSRREANPNGFESRRTQCSTSPPYRRMYEQYGEILESIPARMSYEASWNAYNNRQVHQTGYETGTMSQEIIEPDDVIRELETEIRRLQDSGR